MAPFGGSGGGGRKSEAPAGVTSPACSLLQKFWVEGVGRTAHIQQGYRPSKPDPWGPRGKAGAASGE